MGPLGDKRGEHWVVGVDKSGLMGCLGWTESEKGDQVAVVNGVADWAVVKANIPGRWESLDAEGSCHSAKRPEG